MKKPLLLSKTFFPAHEENKMAHEGDLMGARENYFSTRPNNLHFLLQQRFQWMNEYTRGKDHVYEMGCGAGFSRVFIENPNLKLTDVSKNPWVDMEVDALKMPFADNSVDVIIASHMIHHVATPKLFFDEVKRVLKKGGVLLIHEINTSLMMRLALKQMRHEGYSYDVDVFDPKTIANNPADPWSANCAIPQLLFHDSKAFERHIPGLSVIRNELCEFSIFLLSGGVIAKTRTIPLPFFALRIANMIDDMLVTIAPGIFALGRRVVIRKN
jgi:SAM-dependent methyltransferase